MPRQRATDAPKVVHRTARVALRTTPAQRRRCFGLLRSGGDVWATVLEFNEIRRQRGEYPVVNYQALCRELTAAGPGCFGELSTTGARSILRRYADAWVTTAKRRRQGDSSAHYPRRKKGLVPSRYYAGRFSLCGRHLTLPVARGAPALVLRLTRSVPYEASGIRSVTLVAEGSRLYVDVSAEVPPGARPGADRRGGSGHHPPLRAGRARRGPGGLGTGSPGRIASAPRRVQGAPARCRPTGAFARPTRLAALAPQSGPHQGARGAAPPAPLPGPPRGGPGRHRARPGTAHRHLGAG